MSRPLLRANAGMRMPKGWSLSPSDVLVRFPKAQGEQSADPAGDPPDNWTGTKPEWSIYWAFTKLNYEPNNDFIYQQQVPGLGAGALSVVDFFIPEIKLAIEIQGTFWHLGQGTQKEYSDELRRATIAQSGVGLGFIDEQDAIERPIEILKLTILGGEKSRLDTRI